MNLYLLAILPPSYISEEIDEMRKELSAKYQVFAALKPPVHITLYRPVRIEQAAEEHFIKMLKPVSASHYPFGQQIENFGSFNNKTLFVNTPKNPFIKSLQKDIAAIISRNKIDPAAVKSNSTFNPHITIAYRDVKPDVFERMWEEFKNAKIKRSFMVNHFDLLKHDGLKWIVLKEYPLQKTPELTLF